jgi:DNA-binding protein
MYRKKDRETGYLFAELFPFGGKLREDNRWLKIAGLIPWDELETEYAKHFSEGMGRPALDARLVMGALLLRHMTGVSDEEIARQIGENPYYQAFCGLENFQTGRIFEESSLSRVRKRAGAKLFQELEKKTYRVLVERKIIKGRGLIVDATVYPEAIKFPTDTGLLNRGREWLVGKIEEIGKRLGLRPRTYKRKARQTYLSFSKRRKKTRKVIEKAKKALLQYVRRNLKQLEGLVDEAKARGREIERKVIDRLKVVREMYGQQWKMYREKVRRIEDRIVSLHKPWVRPIVRGKEGKEVEFGPKVAVSHVNGFTFIDHASHDNFNEAKWLSAQVEAFAERFGKKPEWCVGDNLYGNRENRKDLKGRGIRESFVPLGRREKAHVENRRWRKKMNRRRNRVEGGIGHSKEHVLFRKIRYWMEDGAEIWLRLGFLGMNLATAEKRI